MKNLLSIFLLLTLSLLSSCATVKPIDNAQPILAAKELEGRYYNAAKNFPEHSYHNLKSIVDFKDKSGIADVASVEIKVVDYDELDFLFEDNRGISARYRCGYRLEDGKVLLKNKNFRLTGIPYLLGATKSTRRSWRKIPGAICC